MFGRGLEMDLARFRQTQSRSITFGLFTAVVPLLLAPLLDSCSATDHRSDCSGITARIAYTLGSRVVAELGANRLEPVIVTVGATLLSDTLSSGRVRNLCFDL